MSSRVTTVREELSLLQKEWSDLDPTLRFLDIISIVLVAIFGIGYIVVNVLGISLTVSNGAMLIFPLILTGYIYVMRSKIDDETEDNAAAIREFVTLVSITLFVIALTFVYSLILNTVL